VLSRSLDKVAPNTYHDEPSGMAWIFRSSAAAMRGTARAAAMTTAAALENSFLDITAFLLFDFFERGDYAAFSFLSSPALRTAVRMPSYTSPSGMRIGGRTVSELSLPARTIATFMRAWASLEGSPRE